MLLTHSSCQQLTISMNLLNRYWLCKRWEYLLRKCNNSSYFQSAFICCFKSDGHKCHCFAKHSRYHPTCHQKYICHARTRRLYRILPPFGDILGKLVSPKWKVQIRHRSGYQHFPNRKPNNGRQFGLQTHIYINSALDRCGAGYRRKDDVGRCTKQSFRSIPTTRQ